MVLPEGVIYFWNPLMVYTHAITDILISISYFVIGIGVIRLVVNFQDLISYEPRLNKSYYLLASCFFLTAIHHAFDFMSLWVPAYATHAGIRILTAIAASCIAFCELPKVPKFAMTIVRRIRGLETNRTILFTSLDHKTVYLSDDLRSLHGVSYEVEGIQPLVVKLNTLAEEIRTLLQKERLHEQ